LITRSAVLTAPGALKFEEVELPDGELDAASIRADTEYSAISIGTELAAYRGDPPLRPGSTYPRLVGYCNVARVSEVGRQVSEIRPGDQILTHQSHRGAFICPANTVLATVPVGVESPDASMAQFAYLGLRAVRRAATKPGDIVLVLGLGLIGLATVAIAKKSGASVIAFGNDNERLQKAIELGSDIAVDSSDSDQMARFCETFGKTGPDVLITTANPWEAWRDVLEMSAHGSRIVVVGFPGRSEGPPTFNPFMSEHFYDKDLSVHALGPEPDFRATQTPTPVSVRQDMEQILSWVEDGDLPLGALITDTFRWRELSVAYDRAAAGDKSLIGAVLDWRD
jgi:2-desacetyl-2-hydroxyethyl bacteriochlorophyllide A dehydrogenase